MGLAGFCASSDSFLILAMQRWQNDGAFWGISSSSSSLFFHSCYSIIRPHIKQRFAIWYTSVKML